MSNELSIEEGASSRIDHTRKKKTCVFYAQCEHEYSPNFIPGTQGRSIERSRYKCHLEFNGRIGMYCKTQISFSLG
jgi:hypothetical protein